jgi:hypothetical protein
MRKALLVTAAIALVCALAASAVVPDGPLVVPEQRDAEGLFPITAPEVCPQPASRPPASDEIAPLLLAPPPPEWPCPFGAPRCSKDDDCDAYCGDPQFGLCSSFTGCCGCTG